MNQEWLKRIQNMTEVVRPMVTELPLLLTSADLTQEQAQRTFDMLDTLDDRANDLWNEMDDGGADESLMDAIEALQDTIGEMRKAAGIRLHELGGLF